MPSAATRQLHATTRVLNRKQDSVAQASNYHLKGDFSPDVVDLETIQEQLRRTSGTVLPKVINS